MCHQCHLPVVHKYQAILGHLRLLCHALLLFDGVVLPKALRNAFCAGFITLFFEFTTCRSLKGLKSSIFDFRCSTFCVVDSAHYFLTSEAALPVPWNTDSKSRRPWEWVRQYKVLWQVIRDFAAQLHMTRIVGSIEMRHNNAICLQES